MIRTVKCQMVIKLIFFLILGVFFNSCSKTENKAAPQTAYPDAQMELALGTFCIINLYESGSDSLYSSIFSRIHEIDRTMTVHPGEYQYLLDAMNSYMPPGTETLVSDIVAINEQAGIRPVKVRSEIIDILEKSLYYAELSGGAFDPTIGPLVKLWSIGSDDERLPSEKEISDTLELVNWRDVIINRDEKTVFLLKEGMALDLGAIAKGYAGDEAVRIAKDAGVKSGVLDLGGNIVTIGWRTDKGSTRPWRIGVQDPLHERGSYIGILSVHDTCVVTSGVYERYFMLDGKRYHHIFSTETGYPVDNGLLSVTIVTEKSTDADALSTVVFTLGLEQGKALVDATPGVEAVFILDDKSIIITDGLKEIFSLESEEFTLSNF